MTSSRRFLEGGVFRVLAQDVRIWWLDLVGRPTEPLAVAYQENNRRRGLAPGPHPDPVRSGSG
jgi:hypothetical protein